MTPVIRIRTPKPVEAEPEVVLTDYRVYVADDGHHFVGRHGVSGKGRVSSAIATWDPDTMSGTTSSGRRYSLSGPPGQEGGASELVWLAWAASNGIVEYSDVTAEYSPAARPGLN